MNNNFWQLLAIEKTTDITVIRQAYRAKLPEYHPETDPDGFKALREAYELAMQYAKSPKSMADELNQEHPAEEIVKPLTEEERQVKEICDNYQALLDDPARCHNVNEWHKFIASFYDYPMSILEIAKWKMLDISYDTLTISLSCVKILADNLRWRQEVINHSPNDADIYENFFEHIDHGDFFDYDSLPKTNKALQNVTIDYAHCARRIFWEKTSVELNIYLSIHTVVYLPDNPEFMQELANWYYFAKMPNRGLLDYALTCIADPNQDQQIQEQWKAIAAMQYSLLEDEQNALLLWLELYHLPQYQEKSINWLILWCAKNQSDYLPLLILALNQSYCLTPESHENYVYSIPQLTPLTISRLLKLRKENYSNEIAAIITWALDNNWNYRQVLHALLCDDGNSRLYRLYRHAIMLRHGNKTLLQEILAESSEDKFEQFILQNLQRQAKQHLEWLTNLPPVQEFKEWLYQSDENAIIPAKFDPDDEEENQFFYSRLWLNRFDDIPFVAKLHLYNNVAYRNMEMFDWPVYCQFRGNYNLPKSPAQSIIATDKNAYWHWYRYCLLVITIANSPIKAANFIREKNSLFLLPRNDPLTSLIDTFKSNEWQNDIELYNLIDSDLIGSLLINYPNSIEAFINLPAEVNWDEIEQIVEQRWANKLANKSVAGLMLLYSIVFDKANQKTKLKEILQKLAGDNTQLQKIVESFRLKISIPSSLKKDNDELQKIDTLKNLNQKLNKDDAIYEKEDIETLIEIKHNSDITLKLCSTLLLAKNMDHQKKLKSKAFPANKWWQIWRWNGRTNLIGFLKQMSFSCLLILLLLISASQTNLDNTITDILWGVAIINIIFAIKRRLNDCYYNSGIFYFISASLALPILLSPCWLSSVDETNRYGPPITE